MNQAAQGGFIRNGLRCSVKRGKCAVQSCRHKSGQPHPDAFAVGRLQKLRSGNMHGGPQELFAFLQMPDGIALPQQDAGGRVQRQAFIRRL